MMRLLLTFYDIECRLFKKVNRHFDKKLLNLFFRTATFMGGATF
jgi:undecaprenyl-diphosphatase